MLQLSSPTTVQWETTSLCNHRCLHCYNYWRGEKNDKSWSVNSNRIDDIYATIVKEIIKNKVLHTVVTGGEPLLVFEKIYPHIKSLIKHKVIVHINSNLTHITPPIAQKIKELNIPILVSVPSYDPYTTSLITNSKDAYSRLEAGIKLARSYDIELLANMVVTKLNKNQIYETAKYVKHLGIDTFGASKACTPINSIKFSDYRLTLDETRTMFRDLIEVRRELHLKIDSFIGYPTCIFPQSDITNFIRARYCHAGQLSCTIGVNGDVRACPHLDLVYGNIMSDGLKNAWTKMAEWRNGTLTPVQCSHCVLKDTCAGGCKAEALKHFGKLNLPDPYADFTNQMIDTNSLNSKIKLNNKVTYIVNPKLIFRKEDVGGILVGRKLIHLDDKTFEVIKRYKNKILSITTFSKSLSWSKEISKKYYSYLIRDDVLINDNLTRISSNHKLKDYC